MPPTLALRETATPQPQRPPPGACCHVHATHMVPYTLPEPQGHIVALIVPLPPSPSWVPTVTSSTLLIAHTRAFTPWDTASPPRHRTLHILPQTSTPPTPHRPWLTNTSPSGLSTFPQAFVCAPVCAHQHTLMHASSPVQPPPKLLSHFHSLSLTCPHIFVPLESPLTPSPPSPPDPVHRPATPGLPQNLPISRCPHSSTHPHRHPQGPAPASC